MATSTANSVSPLIPFRLTWKEVRAPVTAEGSYGDRCKLRENRADEPGQPHERPQLCTYPRTNPAETLNLSSWLLLSNATLPPDEDKFGGFEQTLYALCKANRDREAIAEALNYFDDRLIARQFKDCERAFRQLQVSKLASSVLVSILGITIRAKQVKGRAIFFERAFQEIARQKGKKYASELLAKYR